MLLHSSPEAAARCKVDTHLEILAEPCDFWDHGWAMSSLCSKCPLGSHFSCECTSMSCRRLYLGMLELFTCFYIYLASRS